MILKEEITKEKAIAEFIKLCDSPEFDKMREEAVGTYLHGNYWDFTLENVVISIRHTSAQTTPKNCFITVSKAYGSLFYNNRTVERVAQHEISQDEYVLLLNKYFGTFTLEKYQMKKIKHILQLTEEINNLRRNSTLIPAQP